MDSVIPLSAKPLADAATASLPRSESSAETIRIALNNNKLVDGDASPASDAADSPPVLLNTFCVRKKRHRVFYNAGVVVWERFESNKGAFRRFLAARPSCERQSLVLLHAGRVLVPIQDVIAINPKTEAAADSLSQGDAIISASAEPQRQHFTVVYAGRSEHSSNRNKWRYKSITFSNSDAHVVRLWIDTLQQAINGEIIFRLENKERRTI